MSNIGQYSVVVLFFIWTCIPSKCSCCSRFMLTCIVQEPLVQMCLCIIHYCLQQIMFAFALIVLDDLTILEKVMIYYGESLCVVCMCVCLCRSMSSD